MTRGKPSQHSIGSALSGLDNGADGRELRAAANASVAHGDVQLAIVQGNISGILFLDGLGELGDECGREMRPVAESGGTNGAPLGQEGLPVSCCQVCLTCLVA